MNMVPLGEFMPSRIPSVNPAKHPGEVFELWSIPAFDIGKPEIVPGSEIGSSKKCVEPGDVLLSRIVPHIRRSWVVSPNTENRQIASGEWITFRSDEFDGRYMRHMLTSDPFHVEFMKTVAGVGGSLLRARPDGVKQIQIPLPPLEEQRRIAGILDQADALRRLRTRALGKLNTLGQAIFHEMFVEGAKEDWLTVQVDDLIANARTGPFGSQLLHSEFVEQGIPVLGIDNAVQNRFVWAKERYISEAKYADLRRYTVLPGDVLITIMGTVGRCAIVPFDIPTAINTKHLCCLTLDQERAVPEFLKACFLGHPDVLRQLGVQAKGAVMPGLNMGIVKALKLQLPPLALQRQFAQKLKAVEQQAQDYEGTSVLAETLFASLQHRAFRGEL